MIAPIPKKGPKGIILLFLLYKITNEIGNPMNDAKNIDTSDIGIFKTKPKVNNNFISPPPIDSFLNRKSPNSFNNSININEPIACNKLTPIPLKPTIKYLIIDIYSTWTPYSYIRYFFFIYKNIYFFN